MISVIVPVYNVEKYLDQCIQSIIGQTYKDFELILVDDGSTDNSGKMCDTYKEYDNRIQVVHKKNGGLSDARNKGTELAIGTYVTYIDSDDYVSDDYLGTLYNLVVKYNADIAVTGIERFYDGDKPIGRSGRRGENCFDGIEALKRVLYQNGMDTSACALLIKKEIAFINKFPISKYHEDDYTTYKYYLAAERVALSSSNQYYYRQRRSSIMHSFGQASLDELDAADNLVNELEKISADLGKAARAKKYSDYCQVLLSDNDIKKNEPNTYRRIKEFISSYNFKMLLDNNARKKNRIAAMCMIMGEGILRKIYCLKRSKEAE